MSEWQIQRPPRSEASRPEPGAAPGQIRRVEGSQPPIVHVMAYGPDELEERRVESVREVAEFRDTHPVIWINVDGLGDPATVRWLGERFDLHPLALEDVTNTHQRPKAEEYGHTYYIVARMLHFTGAGLETEQFSIFLGEGFVITFQETHGDCFDPVRQRIRSGRQQIRGGGADYLAYALLDALVDSNFPILERYSDRIDDLEEVALVHPDQRAMARIYSLKRELLVLRRSIWPLREALGTLLRDPTDLFQESTRLYLRDVQDHTVQIVDLVENHRETATSLLDLYLSSISHRMNEVMKVLTIIATIFIPLGFIAGVYGMNFDPEVSRWNMPELSWAYGYPAAIALMAAIAIGLLFFFVRKGWIGR